MDDPSDQKRAKPDSNSDANPDSDASSDLDQDWVIVPEDAPPLNIIPCTTCLTRHKRNQFRDYYGHLGKKRCESCATHRKQCDRSRKVSQANEDDVEVKCDPGVEHDLGQSVLLLETDPFRRSLKKIRRWSAESDSG